MDADLVERWAALGPVRWGIDDCVPLVADEIDDRIGVDPLAHIRPHGLMPYTSKEERDAYAAEHGGVLRTVYRGLCGHPMFTQVDPSKARATAIGITRIGPTWSLAWHVGRDWWACRMEVGGVINFRTEAIRRAWEWSEPGSSSQRSSFWRRPRLRLVSSSSPAR